MIVPALKLGFQLHLKREVMAGPNAHVTEVEGSGPLLVYLFDYESIRMCFIARSSLARVMSR